MSSELTATDLQAFMDQQGISGEIVSLNVPTPTVDAAAQALEVEPRQIVKSVLFTVHDEGVLTISCGDQLVERRVIAALYGCSRKKVKLATPEVVLHITGFAVGTVPPFGHRNQLRTLIDPRVLELDEVFAGGGTLHALVRLNPQDIPTNTRAEIVDLHTRPV